MMMYSREEREHTKYDGVLSSRDLLNRLQAAAVGIRNFEELNLTQILGEVKEKRVRVKKSTAENTTKSKAEELSEKKLSTPKKASTNSTSKAILKAASKVRKGIVVKELEARENLAFSDSYLEKAFGLSTTAPVSEKPNASVSAKRSANFTDDRPTRKPLKAKTLTTKQSALLSTGDELKPSKKEARPRELGWDGSDEKLLTKKKAKVSAKSIINQRIRVLPHEIRVLPEAALAEVMAAKVLFSIFTHRSFLLYRIILSYVSRGFIIFSTDIVVWGKIEPHLASIDAALTFCSSLVYGFAALSVSGN